MIRCMELAGAQERHILADLAGRDDDEKVEHVKYFFRELKVDEFSREIINNYSEKAFANLEQLDVDPAKKQPLMALAAYLLHRQN